MPFSGSQSTTRWCNLPFNQLETVCRAQLLVRMQGRSRNWYFMGSWGWNTIVKMVWFHVLRGEEATIGHPPLPFHWPREWGNTAETIATPAQWWQALEEQAQLCERTPRGLPFFMKQFPILNWTGNKLCGENSKKVESTWNIYKQWLVPLKDTGVYADTAGDWQDGKKVPFGFLYFWEWESTQQELHWGR